MTKEKCYLNFAHNMQKMIHQSLLELYGGRYKFEDFYIILVDKIEKEYLSNKDESLELCGLYIHAMEAFLNYADAVDDPYDVDGGLAQLYNDAVIVLARQMTSYIMCSLAEYDPEELDNGRIFTVDEKFIDKFTDELYDNFYEKIMNFWCPALYEIWKDD